MYTEGIQTFNNASHCSSANVVPFIWWYRKVDWPVVTLVSLVNGKVLFGVPNAWYSGIRLNIAGCVPLIQIALVNVSVPKLQHLTGGSKHHSGYKRCAIHTRAETSRAARADHVSSIRESAARDRRFTFYQWWVRRRVEQRSYEKSREVCSTCEGVAENSVSIWLIQCLAVIGGVFEGIVTCLIRYIVNVGDEARSVAKFIR